jgi:hypothetical protein
VGEIALLLQILNAANLASPTIVGIINTIRGGRAAGKTDEEITAESMKIALETREITEKDKGSQP